MFQDLAARLPAEIELVGIRAPARESRWAEAPFTDAATLVESLVEQASGDFAAPFGFFGYCTGSVIAFDTARRLRERGLPEPRLLIAVSCQAPDALRPLPGATIDAVERLLRMGGTLGNAALHPELLPIVRRMAEADFAIFDGYTHAPGAPVDVPISVLLGRDDPYVSSEDVVGWHAHTTGEFRLHRIAGSHLLLQTSPRAVVDAVTAGVAALSADE